MGLPLHAEEHALDYAQGRAAAHVADVAAVLVDVADLVDLVAAARVAAEDALVIAAGVMLALVAQGVAVDAKEDVLDLVKGVGDLAVGAVGAVDLVKGAQDALDAEDLVLVHVHRKDRVRLVPHAIVVLAVLVRVLHVHLVEDVLDQVDAEEIVLDAMLGAKDLVKLLASAIAAGAKDLVNRNAQLDARDALDAQEDVVDAQEDVVLDVTAHVLEIATDVVMAVVDNVKTHVLLPAQQHVQVPAKLKHLVPQSQGGVVEDPTVDLIANGMMLPIYSQTIYTKSIGHPHSHGDNYELKDLGISVRYDKQNNNILFDLSTGFMVVDNTLFKQIGYNLEIPLFKMIESEDIKYNPGNAGTYDKRWPPTTENMNGLVYNAGQGYQIHVSTGLTESKGPNSKKYTQFELVWNKNNTTKNYVETGSVFKGTNIIRIPFKITGI